jgi:hypothetical protein
LSIEVLVKILLGGVITLNFWFINFFLHHHNDLEKRVEKVEVVQSTYVDVTGDLRRDSSLGELFERIKRLELKLQ